MRALLFIVLLPMFSEAKVTGKEIFQLLYPQDIYSKDSMINILKTFNKNANEVGNKQTLSKNKFLKMVTVEFPGMIRSGENDWLLKRIYEVADENGDHEVNWTEYLDIIFNLASYLNNEKYSGDILC